MTRSGSVRARLESWDWFETGAANNSYNLGAATHDRNLASRLTDMAGGAAAPPASIAGKSVAGGVGPAPIVYAGAYDATGIEPRHRFGAAGTHTLTLRVTDPSGLSNVTSKQITVKHDDDGGDD